MAVRSTSHRRRRRRRSSRTKRRRVRVPSRFAQIKLRSAEMLASAGVVIVAATLIALIRIAASHSISAERSDLQARIEADLNGQAFALADEVRAELVGVEQSLRILKHAVEADPETFSMQDWREQLPALTSVTDDIFVADDQLIIRHDINPQQVGMGIGANVDAMFGPPPDKPDAQDDLIIGPITEKLPARQHLILMMMRLVRPGGWVVGADYRTGVLTRVFAEIGLGVNGMAALVDTSTGQIRAITGPAATNPTYDIAASTMYAAMQGRPDSTWTGASAPDGVQRIHAFHQVAGRDLSVVLAVDANDAMRPAASLTGDERSVAFVATVVVLAGACIALYGVWSIRAKHRLRQAIEREATLAANAQAEAAATRSRLDSRGGQIEALFGAIAEGTLLLDAELRVMQWNPHFPLLFGIAESILRPGPPLDELLRIQARAGAFGQLDDIESEVARRVAQLSTGGGPGVVIYTGPGGYTLAVFASRHPDGSLLLVIREATEQDLRNADVPALEVAPAPGPIETI